MRQFATGAVRGNNKGKGRYDLIYWPLIRRVAHRMEFGVMPKPNGDPPYPERNWEKGIPDSSFIDSLARHFNDYLEGNRDEDHLAAMVFNIQGLAKNESLPADHALHDFPFHRGVCDSRSHSGECKAPGKTAVGSLAVGEYRPGGSYLSAYEPSR